MKNFQRTKEDFRCGHCKKLTKGNGYTDHCPFCLWSRHTDVNPGDRASLCKGLMKPVGISVRGDKWSIHYRCEKCGYRHKCKTAPQDNFDELLKLSGNPLP